jgi:hypothetical protein
MITRYPYWPYDVPMTQQAENRHQNGQRNAIPRFVHGAQMVEVLLCIISLGFLDAVLSTAPFLPPKG